MKQLSYFKIGLIVLLSAGCQMAPTAPPPCDPDKPTASVAHPCGEKKSINTALDGWVHDIPG